MKIEKIERIESLEAPEWERQKGESEKWHQRFFLYYLGQIGNRSVRTAVMTWAKANEIWDDAKIKSEMREWKQISERNLWLEREIAFDEYQGSLITTQEYNLLSTFKNQGLKLNQTGMKSALKAVKATGEIFEQYIEGLPRKEDGKIDFDELDANKYSKIVTAMKTSADTSSLMLDIGSKILALEKVLTHILENERVINVPSDEFTHPDKDDVGITDKDDVGIADKEETWEGS